MSCAVEFEIINNVLGEKETYFQLDEKKQDVFEKQLDSNNTKVQKDIADELIRNHSLIKGVNKDNYIDSEGTPYQRTTRFIKKLRNGYYTFNNKNYDEDDYNIDIERGNVADAVFEGIILNKSIDEIYNDVQLLGNGITISPKAIGKIAAQVNTLRNLHPGAIFLPQLTLSSSIGVAGTLDLLAIEPDGSIFIYDLKTSKNPITKPWTKEAANGQKYKQYYDKVFQNKGVRRASKKQSHTAQLSIYKAFVESITGKAVQGLAILPAQITLGEETSIEDLLFEPINVHEEDTNLTNAIKEKSTKEQVISDIDTDLTNSEFLETVVSVLEAEVELLKKREKFSSVAKISQILENIQVGRGMSKISEFVEYMHSEFVTDKNSLSSRFKDYISKLSIENLSSSETTALLQDLDEFKSEVDLFKGVVSQLQSMYDKLEDTENVEDGSIISKMESIMNTFNKIERKFTDNVNPILAKILSSQLPKDDFKKKIEGVIKNTKKRLAKTNLSKSAKKRLTVQLKEAEAAYSLSEEYILNALDTGNYKDVSVMSSYLNPAVSMNNTIISTFALTLKENFEKMKINLFKLEKIAGKAFEDFKASTNVSRDKVAEFNKDFYEIITNPVTGKQHYSFIQELDYNSYSRAMKAITDEARREAIEIKSKGQFPNIDEDSLTYRLRNKKAFSSGVRVARKKGDTKIKDPYTGDEVLILEGYETIRKRHKTKMTTNAYNTWLNNQFTFDAKTNSLVPRGKDVTMPNAEKFKSVKYQEVISNKSKADYYKFLIATYFKSQRLVKDKMLYYKLPGVEKIANDRVREGDVKGFFKRWKEKTFNYLPNEEEEYGKGINKNIPHMYSTDLGLENTSLDLIGSVLQYTAAAEKYAVQSNMEPVGKALLDTVKEKGPLHSSEASIADLKIGGKKVSEYFRNYNGNNTAAVLEALIDSHIYGKTRIKQEAGGIKWNKIVDSLMGFASTTQIGGKPVLAVANSLAAHISTGIDAWASEYFSTKTWGWAKVEYRKNEVNFLKDMFGTVKKSKIGQLSELYDALQGEFFDEYGRKLSQGGLKKIWGNKGWFSQMHKGEHAGQVKVMMSILKDTMVTNSKGEEVSLYDSYSLDTNGKLVIDSDINSDLLNLAVQRKIHALNKRFNGVYNTFDKPELERYNIGILLQMYRKFIAPGVRRRFKGWGVDYELGDQYEGYYITFFSKLYSERDELINVLLRKDNNLTKHEVANIRRMVTEITYMILLSSIVALLSAALEGDDDDYGVGVTTAMRYGLYWSMRSLSELSFYNFGLGNVKTGFLPLSPGGTLRTFRTPSAIWSVLDKSTRAAKYTGMLISGNDKAYYSRDMDYDTPFGNLSEKGDPKAVAAFTKLLGVNGYTFNIKGAIKMLELYE